MDYKIEYENNFNSDEECNNYNINEDKHIDAVDTNKLHEVLHQPSLRNIPNAIIRKNFQL